jgi:hypothetical protein
MRIVSRCRVVAAKLCRARIPDVLCFISLLTSIVQLLIQPEVRDRLHAMCTVPVGHAPQAFAALVRAERDKWAKVAREAKIKIEW